jgi:hypothetical protein
MRTFFYGTLQTGSIGWDETFLGFSSKEGKKSIPDQTV